jgi:nucleoside-diphosphate kinase
MGIIERTLVLIKPDAVLRGIAGSILERFERVGLRIVGLKLVQPRKEQLDIHFPSHDEDWIAGMGKKSLENYAKFEMDPIAILGTKDSLEIGKIILGWNYEYLLSGPVVAIILEGPRAISVVRKIIGHTIPAEALPGTIRGDFSVNSTDHANAEKCACKTVVHASGNLEEAKKECEVWFRADELVSYARADEQVMFSKMIKKEVKL